MELCLITDNKAFAAEAESAGIERIMVDLERKGKAQRQFGRELFLSSHAIESVPRMKATLDQARLVVRVNPLNRNSPQEIAKVIDARADYIMLPYFHTVDEVSTFISLLDSRVKSILLVETRSALEILPELLNEGLGDEIHIGLNDLCISLGNKTI